MTTKKKKPARKTKVYSITLPPAVADTLKEIAAEECRSASAQIAYMVLEEVKRRKGGGK